MIHHSCGTLSRLVGACHPVGVSVAVLVSLTAAIAPARATTVNIYASDDSYVRLKDSSNYGGDTGMYVGEYSIPTTPPRIQRPYLKFDLSSIPSGKEIRSADLSLSCSALYNGPVEVGAHYLDCDYWQEYTLVGDGAPTAYRDTATDTVTLVVGLNSWSVTRDVRAAYHGDGEYSVVMMLDSEGTGPQGALLTSKEGGVQPKLTIQYEDGGLDTVVCEPQSGGNPTHPSTYWYEVTPGDFGRCDFHVRVYDRNTANYTNWNLPPGGTWQFRVHQVGDEDDEWWASWWDPDCANPIFSTFTFQFDNDNPSTWGDWATTIDGSSNAFEQVVDSSWSHMADSNGYGYRVHVPSAPTTYTVKPDGTGDVATIQAAIDAAWDRDVIELTDGTYTGPGNQDIDFRGKAITVRSRSGNPEDCVIDCGTNGRGFYFHKGEGPGSVLEGIATTNGYGAVTTNGADGYVEAAGGAVLCNSCSSPSFINCIFSGNTTEGTGGGMACYDESSATLTDCVFSRNDCPQSHGGGLICGSDSSLKLSSCTFFSNTAGDDGGGMTAFSSADLEDCVFADNKTPAHGGGMAALANPAPSLSRCAFYGNWAGTYGGGLSSFTGGIQVDNSLFSGNCTDVSGGGMYCSNNASSQVTNCTFSRNSAPEGSGMSVTWNSSAVLANTIIAFNSNGTEAVYCEAGSSASLSYCDVYGNDGGDWIGCLMGQLGITGNISQDPLFVDANGSDATTGTLDDNLRLGLDSPCIDAADNPSMSDTIDLDRYARFVDDPRTPDTGSGTPPIVDMGAYEFRPGDSDRDGDVDLHDYAAFKDCLQGPGGGLASGCDCFDFDRDFDVDLKDFGAFQASFTGEECREVLLTGFEGYANGTEVTFRPPRFSGSTDLHLELTPNVREVTDEVTAFSGDKCYKLEWQFIDDTAQRWLRATSFQAANIPNPTIELDKPVQVRLRLDSGSLRVTLGVRETGTTANVGEDGGVNGAIEWVGADSQIDMAPQGKLLNGSSGIWQTLVFDPLSDPIRGFALGGDGTLSSPTNKGTLEHLAFSSTGDAGPFTVYIDEIKQLCPAP